jgi:AraC-like DNA-binding protein
MIDLLFLGSLFFALVTAYILFTHTNRYQAYANKLLGLLLLANCWSILGYLLISSKWILYVPILYKTFIPINFAIPPLLFLYTSAVLKNEKHFKTKYLAHFVLFFIVFISYLPFYCIEIDKKRLLVNNVINNLSLNYQNTDSIIPEWLLYIARIIQFSIYLIMQVVVIKNNEQVLLANSKIEHTKAVLNWLKVLTGLFISVFLSFLIIVILVSTSTIQFEQNRQLVIPGLLLAISFFTISVYLLIRPQLLFGLPYLQETLQNKDPHGDKLIKEQDLSSIYSHKIELINTYIKNEQPYLIQGLTIYDLANAVKLSPRETSFIINHCMKVRFNDFINYHRIIYVQMQINQGYLTKFTIESLYLKAGFTNKVTFNAAFKKVLSCTPSEYLSTNNK